MFDELKKKLKNAVSSFIKTEKAEIEAKPPIEAEKKSEPPVAEVKAAAVTVEKPAKVEEKKYAVPETEKVVEKAVEPVVSAPKPQAKPVEKAETHKENLINLSLKTKIKSVFVGTVRLNDSDIARFLETMKVSMLQSDVSYDTTEYFLTDLKTRLEEKPVSSRNIEGEVTGMIRNSLLSVLTSTKTFDLMQLVKGRVSEGSKPVKILFLGPNGTGKTTTIAKLAYGFKNAGISSVLSASDTFRAAAIEQLEHHANKIGVPVIRSSYGADPASVAFDAIAYAKAHGIDAVLIDSAGRQETNKSLIEEMKKMVRVAKPDLIIFVGESTAGNMISEQIKEFSKFMAIDGIILTKLDCDAKGGGALSIAHTTGRPVLFFGTGEGYDALIPYDPNFVIDAILPGA